MIKLKLLVLIFLLFNSIPAFAEEENMISAIQDSAVNSSVDSVNLLKEQLSLDSANHQLRLKLAQQLLIVERLDAAAEQFKLLADIDSFKVAAMTGLGKVYFYRAPSRIIPLERLKELLKIDFRSKAIKMFLQVLEIDKDYLPARYFLARSYMRKEDSSSLSNAKKQLEYILLREPDYRDLTYQLGLTYQKMKKWEKSLVYFAQINDTMADYARARIRMAEVQYELGKHELSTKNYYQGVENLIDKTVLDYLYEEQKILLTKKEKDEFVNSPYSKKSSVFARFWKSRDPDPSTPANERLMEHFRRTRYARTHYHFTAPPYYDDRGQIYIKYGEPDARYNSTSGTVPVKDNESWSYEHIEEGLVFDFVADGAYFRRVADLTEAALSGYSYEQRLMMAYSLYQERNHLSKTYSRLSVGFSQDRLNDFHATRNEAITKYPGEVYVPKNARKYTFPFITKWAQFRGEENQTRVEFYTSFPGQALKINPIDNNAVRSVEFYIEIDDTNYSTILMDNKRLGYQIEAPAQLSDNQFIFQNNYSFQPGTYNAAFVIKDVETSNKGVQRKELKVRNFSSDSLQISSLQLAEEIFPQSESSNLTFSKNGLTINPYTFTRVMRKKPISLYFEIYNLSLNADGNTNFEVSYTVETIKADRNFWQKTIGGIGRIFTGGKKKAITTTTQRLGESRDAFEYITFDLKNLDRGLTNLRVQINDRISGEQVESEIEMILIDN